MCVQAISTSRLISRAVVLALGMSTSACSSTRTQTTVRTTADRSTQHFRLVRPDAPPLSAEWVQKGHLLTGKLSFSSSCQTEIVQVKRRAKVEETGPNPAYTTTMYVIGSILAATGTGLLVASSSKDETVSCGDGGNVAEGDHCSSVAGHYREAGAITIALGAGTILGGLIVAHRKPETKDTPLPDERQVTLVPATHGCGEPSQLAGVVVTASLADGGKWSGTVDGNGDVAIELGHNLNLQPGMTARFSVESVPAGSTELLVPGIELGEIELLPSRK